MRTGRLARVLGAATLVAGIATAGSAVVLSGAGAAVAGTGGGGGGGGGDEPAYTCTGGTTGVPTNIRPGTYESLTVSGVCTISFGNVRVEKNVTVEPGALLDNGAPGDPTTAPTVAGQLYVGGNVTVGKGAVLILGCSPNSACGGNPTGKPPTGPGISSATIRGSVTAIKALAVVVHSSFIGGNFTVIGGGGGVNGDGTNGPPGGVETGFCFTTTPPAPWTEDPNLTGNPVYTDVEDASIGGNYTVVGLSSCWMGSLRNQIRGSATFIGNQFGDPDAMEIGNNLIGQNLTCFKNVPAPQFGDGASSDLVAGRATGQCGFDVVLQNPAAEAIPPTTPPTPAVGVEQHFVVSTRHLKTYFGTFTPTSPDNNLESVPTTAGNTISADVFSFAFAGNGLVGTGTSTGAPPPGPGAAVLSTTFPNGDSTFTTFLGCDDTCSFAGKTGPVTLRAYGTTDKHGFTSGTFLITTSGFVITPTTPAPGLTTLVGYGSFWGSGATLHLIEHLGFG